MERSGYADSATEKTMYGKSPTLGFLKLVYPEATFRNFKYVLI